MAACVHVHVALSCARTPHTSTRQVVCAHTAGTALWFSVEVATMCVLYGRTLLIGKASTRLAWARSLLAAVVGGSVKTVNELASEARSG
eukprot:6270188-Prymnesium_polylepis.1